MIVKNESSVIRRCLDSVLPFIDTWVIVDTGSEDGTQEIIRKHLKKIPGELYERPWVHFGHNRNEAMQFARGKADYLLLIDADDRLVVSKGFRLPPLEADMYSILQREGEGTTFREHHVYFLIRNDTDLEWKGVIHEYLSCPTNKSQELLTGIFCEYINDGNRSKDPNKCQKDIALLEQAILDDPADSRSVLYLARTYWSIRDWERALSGFQKRANMGGDPIEVYYSLLCIALAQKNLNLDSAQFLDSFAKAHLFRPTRTEAIYEMGRYYVESNNPLLGFALLKVASTIPSSTDNLFVETWVNEWGIPLFLFLASLMIGDQKEAKAALDIFCTKPSFPQDLREKYQIDEWVQRLVSQNV